MKKPFYLKKVKRKKGYVFLYRLNRESKIVKEDEKTYHVVNPPLGEMPPTSRALAEKYVFELIAQKKTKKSAPSDDLTLSEYAEPFYDWERCPHIARITHRRISPKTARYQRANIKNHVLTDPIAEKRLSEVSVEDIVAFRGRVLNKGLSRGTVYQIMNALRVIFREAYLNRKVDFNPALLVPRIEPEYEERGVFTGQELRWLFKDVPGYFANLEVYTVFLLAAATGMRMSELLRLPVGNVHLFDRIDVFETWKDRDVSGPPKWNKPRSIPIPEFLSEVIQSYLEDRVRINPNDLLFCEELTGNRRGETWWNKNYYKALKQAEIAVFDARGKKRQPHSLRHTLNTLLLDQGCNPLKVQFYLGWGPSSKVSVLTKVQKGYTHFAVEGLRELIPVIEKIFLG